jgi:hypothetical protein
MSLGSGARLTLAQVAACSVEAADPENRSAQRASDLRLLFGGKLPDGNGSPIFPICRQACLVPEQSTKGADLRQDEGTFLVLPFVLAGSSQRFHRRCVHSHAHSLIE